MAYPSPSRDCRIMKDNFKPVDFSNATMELRWLDHRPFVEIHLNFPLHFVLTILVLIVFRKVLTTNI